MCFHLIKWNDKVRVVPATHEYIGPKIREDVQQVIYEAVLREQKFSGSYQSRESQKPKKGIYNPLAIISHGVVTRVICTRELKGEADNLIRYLPLHRFKSASPLEDSINIPKEFDLDEYLDKGELNYLYDKEIDLHLEFSQSAGSHLIETPFSKNQSIKIIKKYSEKVPLRRMMDLEELWPAIMFLLDPKNTYMTGSTLTIDGGFTII